MLDDLRGPEGPSISHPFDRFVSELLLPIIQTLTEGRVFHLLQTLLPETIQ